MMVDEPTVSTRPNDADEAVRSTSQHEVEWRDGLSRLMSNLEEALTGAHRQATDVVKGIERQGQDLLSAPHEHRTVTENELRETRAASERESARLVSEAESRSAEIIAA